MLTENCSNDLLILLTQDLGEETIFPQEYIFKEEEEEYQEKNLYFIQEGEIEIVYVFEKTEMLLAKKGKFDYFGEISFFTNSKRTASARSSNFSNVFNLKRKVFLDMLCKFPKDH